VNRRQALRYGAVAVVLAVGLNWLLSPYPTRADTVQGTGTNGACVTEWTLWGGDVTGIASLTIGYRAKLTGDPTVLWGGWHYGSTAVTGHYWHTSGVGSGTWFGVGSGWNADAWYYGAELQLVPGSVGTASYKVRVPGYASGSCVTLDSVRVTRSFVVSTGPGPTPPSGGGGASVNPSPTAAPTQPGSAPTPNASPGASDWCVIDATGAEVCYPPPPTGFCYTDLFLAFGTGTAYQPCDVPPTWVPPTPTPPPDVDWHCTWSSGSPCTDYDTSDSPFVFSFTKQGGNTIELDVYWTVSGSTTFGWGWAAIYYTIDNSTGPGSTTWIYSSRSWGTSTDAICWDGGKAKAGRSARK